MVCWIINNIVTWMIQIKRITTDTLMKIKCGITCSTTHVACSV